MQLLNIAGTGPIFGVVVCPITSGDTAFRSARLILAEITRLDQKKIRNRLIITLPAVFMTAVSLTYILMADEGFGLSAYIAYPIGIGLSLALFCLYHFTRAMARRGKFPQKNKN